MSDFIKPLGSISSGVRPRKFNPKIIRDTDERSIEQQYEEATEEEQAIIYQRAKEISERNRMIARMVC